MPDLLTYNNIAGQDISSARKIRFLMEIFEKDGPVRICAPMVRYSKLAFRNLVRLYDVDVAFSPMILADSFYQSQAARDNELTTNSADKPLIVQFAANNALYFAGSAELGKE